MYIDTGVAYMEASQKERSEDASKGRAPWIMSKIIGIVIDASAAITMRAMVNMSGDIRPHPK